MIDILVAELRDKGWVVGRNLVIEFERQLARRAPKAGVLSVWLLKAGSGSRPKKPLRARVCSAAGTAVPGPGTVVRPPVDPAAGAGIIGLSPDCEVKSWT